VLASAVEGYRDLLARWTRSVTARPWLVVATALCLTIASIFFLSRNLAVDTSTGDMLSEKLDFRKFNREMDAAFPQFSDTLLVVIDGQSIDLADAAAHRLAARMRAQPHLYGSIYDLAGESFFRKNGLLYLDIDGLYTLSDKLADAQPFLASLWRDPSLNGLFTLLGKALDAEASDSDVAAVEIGPFLDRITAVAQAQIDGRFAELSWRSLMQGDDDGANANRRFLLLQPALDFGSLQPAADAMAGVRGLVQELQLTADNGLRVRLSGPVALEQEELESVEEGMGLAGILSFVLVMALLVLGLRKGWLVVSCLITLAVGLIWTGAFAIAALGSLNLISVAFAVLFIGLSVDFGIHYALRYLEGIQAGTDSRDALVGAARSVGGALSLSAMGAAIAFYSFLPTDYNGLAELGLIAGTGMFIALIANMTLLPALLVLRPLSAPAITAVGTARIPGSRLLQSSVSSRCRAVTWTFIGAGLLALFALPQVAFDFDPLNLKNRQTESMSTLIDLMADSRTSPYTIDILAKDLDSAIQLAAKLSALDEVESAETIADYVPQDQDEKRDVIASMSLFLAPAFAPPRGSMASEITAGAALASFIDKLESAAPSANLRKVADVLGKIADQKGGAESLERRLLVHLPAQLDLLRDSLNAQPVTLADLPEALKARKMAADGRVTVEVFPKYDVTDRQLLTAFVDAVRSLAPRAVGSPVVILEAGRAILGAFFQAGVISIVLIAVLIGSVLGNLRDVFLVFTPLLLAAVFTLAASAIFGLAFNFANVIVLPLLFGLGIAGAIHLVLRARRESGEGGAMATSTPRAILYSALTTMGSFGSIALSGHPGTASMGVLLTIAITLTLICTLVFLPALMACLSRREAGNDGQLH